MPHGSISLALVWTCTPLPFYVSMDHGWKARGWKPPDWEAQDWKTQDWETQDWETQDDWKTQGWKDIRQKTSDRNSEGVIRLEDLTKDPWQAPGVRQERAEKTSAARAKMQAAAEVSKAAATEASKAAATAAAPEMHHPQEDAKDGKYDRLEQRMLQMEEEFKGLKTCVQNILHPIKEQPLENKSAGLPRWLAGVDEADSSVCGAVSLKKQQTPQVVAPQVVELKL